jgi:hypothetical protein
MNKAFTKYLLLLCILLLSGCSHLYAQQWESTSSPSNQTTKGFIKGPSIGSFQNDLALHLKIAAPGAEKDQSQVYSIESESEEDKSGSFRKMVESSIYFTALLYANILAFLLGLLASVLHFCKHFSNFSAHRLYLIFGVFRI